MCTLYCGVHVGVRKQHMVLMSPFLHLYVDSRNQLSASIASSLTQWVILLALIVLHLKENKHFRQKDWREPVGRGRACTENTAGLES